MVAGWPLNWWIVKRYKKSWIVRKEIDNRKFFLIFRRLIMKKMEIGRLKSWMTGAK